MRGGQTRWLLRGFSKSEILRCYAYRSHFAEEETWKSFSQTMSGRARGRVQSNQHQTRSSYFGFINLPTTSGQAASNQAPTLCSNLVTYSPLLTRGPRPLACRSKPFPLFFVFVFISYVQLHPPYTSLFSQPFTPTGPWTSSPPDCCWTWHGSHSVHPNNF